jgi:hypothetical protein
MKTRFIYLTLIAAMSIGCKQFKKPEVCVEGPETCDVGEQVTFTWCDGNADYITWDSEEGGHGEGRTFTTSFNKRGPRNITVKARNKIVSKKLGFQARRTWSISVGKSYVWCGIYNRCSGAINNGSDLVNYKAYLYSTIKDWEKDVDNGNHNSCLDSAGCGFSSEKNSIGAYFRKSFPVGSIVYVSVEYRNPQYPNKQQSNWGSLVQGGTSGCFVNINYNNDPYNDNWGDASIEEYAIKVLKGKWRLTSLQINGIIVSVPYCSQDDYIKFYANGTWKYHVGSDNCNGAASESTGSYNKAAIPICSGGTMGMSTNSGPFKVINSSYFSSDAMQLFVYVTEGSNNVQYTFNYYN